MFLFIRKKFHWIRTAYFLVHTLYMIEEIIINKDEKEYKISIDNSSLKNISQKEEFEKWELKVEVCDGDGLVGLGFFEMKILADNKYALKLIMKKVTEIGLEKLKKNLDGKEIDLCNFRIYFDME